MRRFLLKCERTHWVWLTIYSWSRKLYLSIWFVFLEPKATIIPVSLSVSVRHLIITKSKHMKHEKHQYMLTSLSYCYTIDFILFQSAQNMLLVQNSNSDPDILGFHVLSFSLFLAQAVLVTWALSLPHSPFLNWARLWLSVSANRYSSSLWPWMRHFVCTSVYLLSQTSSEKMKFPHNP